MRRLQRSSEDQGSIANAEKTKGEMIVSNLAGEDGVASSSDVADVCKNNKTERRYEIVVIRITQPRRCAITQMSAYTPI